MGEERLGKGGRNGKEEKGKKVRVGGRRKRWEWSKINVLVPLVNDVIYPGIHFDRRLAWRKHIFSKITSMKIREANLYSLLNKNSKLSLDNKVLLLR